MQCTSSINEDEPADIEQGIITDNNIRQEINNNRREVRNNHSQIHNDRMDLLTVLCINVCEIIIYPFIFKFLLIIFYHIIFNTTATENLTLAPSKFTNEYAYVHITTGFLLTFIRCCIRPIKVIIRISN